MEKRVRLYSSSCGYAYEEIVGYSKDRLISIVRGLIWLKLRNLNFTTREIASFFNRNQSSINRISNRASDLIMVKDAFAIAVWDKIDVTERIDNQTIDIIYQFSKSLDATIDEILGKRKTKELTVKRFIIWDCLYQMKKTYDDIGRAFNKSPSTIHHGCSKLRDYIYVNDPVVLSQLQKINY